jgi:EAL domain-containing protein (putative c-di-GMP-specific phosphodiesterase class I)
MQGYLFSPPRPAADIRKMLAAAAADVEDAA